MKNVSAIAATLFFLASAAAQAADPHTTALITSSLVALQRSNWAAGAHFASTALRDHRIEGDDALTANTSLCVQAVNAGEFEHARSACDRSIRLAPHRWSVYLNRANLRMMLGDRIGAAADYAMAKSLNPKTDIVDRAIDSIAHGQAPQYVVLLPPALPEHSQTATAN